MELFGDGIAWLADPANWTDPRNGILLRLWEHVSLSAVAFAVAAAIALPIGLVIGHTGRGAGRGHRRRQHRAGGPVGRLARASCSRRCWSSSGAVGSASRRRSSR